MSTEQPEQQGTGPVPEESTQTADVREAIERAREATAEAHAESDAAPSPELYAEPNAAPVDAPFAEQPLVEQPVTTAYEQVPPPSQPVQEWNAQAPVESSELYVQQPLPSAAAEPIAAPPVPPAPTMAIPADHPMAGLYFQQPNPPTPRGNRGAGVLISLLATLVFAVLYAGVLALFLGMQFPPSTFLSEAFLPYLSSWGFILPVATFFALMVLLVVIFNRAGWWVYSVLGLIVALGVLFTAGLGFDLAVTLPAPAGWWLVLEGNTGLPALFDYAFTFPAILAAFAAREVTVWFGAWIGARGRKIKARNIEAQTEYQAKLAELQVPQA